MNKQLLIARICAGKIYLELEGSSPGEYYILPPNIKLRYEAEVLYEKELKEAHYNNLFDEDEAEDLLRDERNGFWTDDDDSLLSKTRKDIEDFQVGYYENQFKEGEAKRLKGLIKEAKRRLYKLYAKKNTYHYLTAQGFAESAKLQFLVHRTLYNEQDELVMDDELTTETMTWLTSHSISEAEFREIARSEPWITTWVGGGKTCEGLFGIPSINMSDEQRALFVWSMTYDNLRNHPTPPTERVINDDDLLDGWMIVERRKKNEEDIKDKYDKRLTNKNVANSDHIFIMKESDEELNEIESLNSPAARYQKRRREAKLNKDGVVNELHMPDTQERLISAFHAKMAQQQG